MYATHARTRSTQAAFDRTAKKVRAVISSVSQPAWTLAACALVDLPPSGRLSATQARARTCPGVAPAFSRLAMYPLGNPSIATLNLKDSRMRFAHARTRRAVSLVHVPAFDRLSFSRLSDPFIAILDLKNPRTRVNSSVAGVRARFAHARAHRDAIITSPLSA